MLEKSIKIGRQSTCIVNIMLVSEYCNLRWPSSLSSSPLESISPSSGARKKITGFFSIS